MSANDEAEGLEDEQTLRAQGARIERLLDELEGLAGPVAWPRIEELVRSLVGLYGEGLARVIAHAEAVAPGGPVLGERLASDELVSGLLLLHGIHPLSPRVRAERAFAMLVSRVGPSARGVWLVHVDDRTASLRVDGGDETARAFAAAASRALSDAAPELEVRVEGIAPPPPRNFVSVDRLRPREGG